MSVWYYQVDPKTGIAYYPKVRLYPLFLCCLFVPFTRFKLSKTLGVFFIGKKLRNVEVTHVTITHHV